jgi:predicted nicotinamide N-methyase
MPAEDEDDHWQRSFSFRYAEQETAFLLRVSELFGAGLGGTCWSGGLALARHLADGGGAASCAAELISLHRPLSALELGAGCSGLPSLVLARSGHFSYISLAELDESAAERLQENLLANEAVAGGATLRVLCLDWADAASLPPPPDLLLAADVVYSMERSGGEKASRAAAALVSALSSLCGPSTVVLLGNMLKPLSEEGLFCDALFEVFSLEVLEGDAERGVFRLRRRAVAG